MLNECNEIVKNFLSAKELQEQFKELPVRTGFLASWGKKDHNCTLLTSPKIVALIIGDFGIREHGKDVIVEHRQQGLKRISDLHPLFMSLQYPLLFPHGEDCFHLNILYEVSHVRSKLGRLYLTM